VRSLVLIVSLIAAATIAFAQEPTVQSAVIEGHPISRIEFDPPDQPLTVEELGRLLPFKPGELLKLTDIRAGIQKLYDTGRYSNISVSAEPANGSEVVVRVATEFNYFVSGVSIDGVAEPPTKGQLYTATKFDLGTEFRDGDLKQATENIEERLRANGLYHATVTSSVDRIPATEEIHIRFQITPGKRARFDGVQVSGDTSRPLDRITHDTRWHRGLGPITLPGWRNVTESLIQSGVGRVLQGLQRGDHLQATVALQKVDYHAGTNTVTPSLHIQSGPTLHIEAIGAKISNGKLHQLIPVYEERAVDRSLLMEGRRNLIDYFQSQGYFDVQVDLDENSAVAGAETIDYRVVLNARHALMDVIIQGHRYFDTVTLRERLETTPAHFPRSRFGHFSQRTLDRDVEAMHDLYRSNGFREAEVTPAIVDDYKDVKGNIAVRITIREGPQWFVNKLELEGVPESDREYLRSLLQSTEGQPFSEANVAADRDNILGYYYNNGYPDASFEWTQAEGPNPHSADLHYTVQTGKREYARSVLVRGLETTRPSIVNNRISLKPGDPISQRRIAESQQKLYDLGIFSKVQTAIQNPEGLEEQKYVVFALDEANRYSFNAGIGAQLGRIGNGVTTFDEPAGTTGFVPRISLGVSRLNFLGLARTVSLQTRFSTLEQRVLLSYTAPQFMANENLTLTVSGLFDNSRDVRTFAARRYEGSIQLAEKLTRQYSVQYRYTFRRVTTSDLVISPELIPLFSQPERVGQISMTFIQDRRDDPINSHRGMYNTVDAGMSLKPLGSQTEFTRLLMRNSTYHPIGRNVVFARTLQFGWIQRTGGLPEIPLAERFFAGGATSNRAFPDNQAGPRDLETGFPLGGNALLMHSMELRFPLLGDNLGGVLFHDMGNVYDDVRDINLRFRQRDIQDFNYTVHAFGFGVRYRTPIGPIRVDLSFSPDSPRFFGFQGTFDQLLANQGTATNQRINQFQFHFSLGQTF
jgi:outer membrane protein insertion porin family